MSTFAVTIERIASVWAHSNADRLEMARLKSMSYQFIVGKGAYQPDELVVYFPIDSLLPEKIITTLELTGKLAGSDKNRVKTVRLRGAISQGVVARPEMVIPDWTPDKFAEGQDVTELLGVIKYDPPPMISDEGALGRMPPMVSVYDIEGAERFVDSVEKYLMDKPVMISEKVEGSHFSASLYKDGEIVVCRRRYSVTLNDGKEHEWARVARTSGIYEVLSKIKAELDSDYDVDVVTIRGEMIGPGIQGNIYTLKDRQIRIFEIEVNGEPINAHRYVELVKKYDLVHAPILSIDVTLRDWLAGRSLAEASNGQSLLLSSTRREGVVIRPIDECHDEKLGRVIIKQRSPEYLAHSDF